MTSYYPIQDYGPLIKGMAIGGLGILHIFLVEMAFGGGLLLCYFEWLRRTGRSRNAGRFINGNFQTLVLVGFVTAVLTGVTMWFTAIQINPRMIGVLVDEFHWFWATEWTCFCVEFVSGYAFLRYKDRLSGHGRMLLLVFYTAAAWSALFWINGTLSFPLTPGRWAQLPSVWPGFFNPSFWPSLVCRTVAAMAIAALAACLVINLTGSTDRQARRELIGQASTFLAPTVFLPLLAAWYLASMPPDSGARALGLNATVPLLLGSGVAASLFFGAGALAAFWSGKLDINTVTAAFLCVIALAATAGGELVREQLRKPDSIRQVLYSNWISQDELERLRKTGSVSDDHYPLRDGVAYPNTQLEQGARVYRFQCRLCHTYDGARGLLKLTGSWTLDQKRLNIAQMQRSKSFMPPFAGTPAELEGLVQLLTWRHAGMPRDWPVSNDPATLAKIQGWLDEVGTTPGVELAGQGGVRAVGRQRVESPVEIAKERR